MSIVVHDRPVIESLDPEPKSRLSVGPQPDGGPDHPLP